MYPDFEILDELGGLLPGAEGAPPVSGHTQIFREAAGSLADLPLALARLRRNADNAIAYGRGWIFGEHSTRWDRHMSGAQELEKKFGPIPAYRWQLAILRPLEIRYSPVQYPSHQDEAKAAEIGLELLPTHESWEYLIEFGLDVSDDAAQPRRL
jgi:hypothetical protein